jgi:hypothetical protein
VLSGACAGSGRGRTRRLRPIWLWTACLTIVLATLSSATRSASAESISSWASQAISPPSDAVMQPNATLNGVACPSLDNCVAVGTYSSTEIYGATDGENWDSPMVATEADGEWGQAVGLDRSAFSAFDNVYLNSVSCSSNGMCIAVGWDYSNTAIERALFAVESDGTWGPVTYLSVLPSNATTDASIADSYLLGVACEAGGACYAVGSYTDASGVRESMVATFSSGKWTAASEVLAPPGANANPNSQLRSISCPDSDSCSAVGIYQPSGQDDFESMATSQSRSHPQRWRRETELTPPQNGGDVGFSSISCEKSNTCLAIGGDSNAPGFTTISAMETNGVWSSATAIPTESTNPLYGVSCVSGDSCVAVGDDQPASEGFVVPNSGGMWRTGGDLSPPTINAYTALQSVTCVTAASCTAVGDYSNSVGGYPLVATGSVGGGSSVTSSYVALGDSYSSGEGAIDGSGNPSFEPSTNIPKVDECHRSLNAWPELLSNELGFSGGSFAFAACSGARVANFVKDLPGDGGWSEGPQLDAISPSGSTSATTQLVTLSVGGNDVGFVPDLAACIHGFGRGQSGCTSQVSSRLASGIALLTAGGIVKYNLKDMDNWKFCPQCNPTDSNVVDVPSLSQLYVDIQNRAPNAHILVMGYPELFPANTTTLCVVGTFTNKLNHQNEYKLDPSEMNTIDSAEQQLNSTIEGQVGMASSEGVNITFVPTYSDFQGHGPCDTVSPNAEWINGLQWDGNFISDISPFSFHPDAAGQMELEQLVVGYEN